MLERKHIKCTVDQRETQLRFMERSEKTQFQEGTFQPRVGGKMYAVRHSKKGTEYIRTHWLECICLIMITAMNSVFCRMLFR